MRSKLACGKSRQREHLRLGHESTLLGAPREEKSRRPSPHPDNISTSGLVGGGRGSGSRVLTTGTKFNNTQENVMRMPEFPIPISATLIISSLLFPSAAKVTPRCREDDLPVEERS